MKHWGGVMFRHGVEVLDCCSVGIGVLECWDVVEGCVVAGILG